jgi:hypothetical protein
MNTEESMAAVVIVAIFAAAIFYTFNFSTNANYMTVESYDAASNLLVVRNTGYETIDTIQAFVDNQKVDVTLSPIGPGTTGEVFIGGTLEAGEHTVRLVSADSEATYHITVPDMWYADVKII